MQYSEEVVAFHAIKPTLPLAEQTQISLSCASRR